MSSIPQNYCDENELIDCVQRFFSRHHVGKLTRDLVWDERKRCFTCFSAPLQAQQHFLSEEACICSNELALLRKIFQRTLFIGS